MSKPFVLIELDKPRRLRYGMNALVLIEEVTGKTLSEMLKNKNNLEGDEQGVEFSFKDVRTIIYAGLSHEDKDLTPEIVGELIDEYGDLEEITTKMGEAFEISFGKKK